MSLSSCIQFRGAIPPHAKKFLLNPPQNAAGKQIDVDSIIGTLKEITLFSDKIVINQFASLTKFHIIETTKENKEVIDNLIAHILFGNGSPIHEKMSKLENKEFWQTESASELFTHEMKYAHEIYLKIPRISRASYIKIIMELLKNTSKQQQKKILHSFDGLSGIEIVEILKKVSPLINDSQSGLSKCKILRIICDIPKNEWKDVNERAQPLFQNIKDEAGKARILEVLSHIPKNKRKEIIAQSIPLFDEVTHGETKALILEIISEISPTERGDKIANTKLLYNDTANKNTIDTALKFIAALPDSLFTKLLNESPPLLKKISDGLEKIRILKQIFSTPIAHWKRFSEEASFFFENLKVKGIQDEFMQSFKYHPIEDWLRITKISEPLIKNLKLLDDKKQIIFGLKEIPDNDQEDIIAKSLELVSEKDSATEQSFLISYMSKISTDQREDVIKKASSLFYEGLSCADKIKLVRALVPFKPDQRENIVRYTKTIIQDNPKIKEIETLLVKVSQISSENIEVLIPRALPYMNECSTTSDKGEILHLISKISEDEWDAVNRQTQFLRSAISKSVLKSCHSLMKAIFEIPKIEREEFITLVAPLLSIVENEQTKANLMKALYPVPHEERLQLLPILNRLAKESEKTEYIYDVLVELKKIAPTEWNTIIEMAQDIMPKIDFMFDDLISSISSIPIDQRKDVIKRAKFFTNLTGFKGTVLITINMVSPCERDEFMEMVKILIGDTKDSDKIVKILTALCHTPQEQRQDVCKSCLQLFGKTKSDSMGSIIEALNEIPPNDRKYVIEICEPLFKKALNRGMMAQILTIVAKIPADERYDVINKMVNLIPSEVWASGNFASITKALRDIPENRRHDLISMSKLLYHNARDNFLEILKTVASIPEFKLNQILKLRSSIFRDHLFYGENLSSILKEVSSIPEFDLEDVLRKAWKIRPTGAGIEDVIAKLKNIPFDHRDEVIEAAKLLMINTAGSGEDIGNLLHEIYWIPSSRRMVVVKKLQQITNVLPELHQKIRVVSTVSNFEIQALDDIITHSEALREGIFTGLEMANILFILFWTPSEERADLVEKTLLAANQGPSIENVLGAIAHISFERRKEVLDKALSLGIKSSSNYHKQFIIQTIYSIPPDEWEDVLLAADLLCKNDYPLYLKCEILKNVHNLETAVRNEIVAYVKPFMDKIKLNDNKASILCTTALILKEERTYEVMEWITCISNSGKGTLWPVLELVSPEKRVQGIKLLFENLKSLSDTNKMLSFLFHNYEDIKIASHLFLQKTLEEAVKKGPLEALKIAEKIIYSNLDLFLMEENILFQTAMEALVSCNSDKYTGEKNPHKLYLKLRKDLKGPYASITPPSFLKNFEIQLTSKVGETLPIQTLKTETSINIDYLRSQAETRKSFTIADLPKDIGPDTIKKLIQSHLERLEKLPYRDKVKAEKYISDSYFSTLKAMSESLLSLPLTMNLLLTKGSPSTPIENTVLYLFSILNAIQKSDTKVSDKCPLTNQEILLANFLNSIKNCSTGQRDGIVGFYNFLDVIYRHSGVKGEMGNIEKIDAIMWDTIQKVLSDIFHGESFVKSLIGIPPGSQASHVTLYLENRFSRDVGRIHQLLFDMHSTSIIDEILGIDSQFALDKFFRELPPEKIMRQFRMELFQVINLENKKIDMQLAENLENFKKLMVGEKTELISEICTVQKQFKNGRGRLANLIYENKKLIATSKFASFSMLSDLELEEILEGFKKKMESEKNDLVTIIESVLDNFKKGTERLANLVYKNKKLSSLPKFASLPMSTTEQGIRQYFEDKISLKYSEYYGWQENCLNFDQEGLFLKDVSDLGILELFRAGNYFIMVSR